MVNYTAPLPDLTAAATWSRARWGEDDADVEVARSSAKCAKWEGGPVVIGGRSVLARVEGKENPRVG